MFVLKNVCTTVEEDFDTQEASSYTGPFNLFFASDSDYPFSDLRLTSSIIYNVNYIRAFLQHLFLYLSCTIFCVCGFLVSHFFNVSQDTSFYQLC